MKETVIKLLSSALKATAISLVLAAIAYAVGLNATMVFGAGFIGQFVIFYLSGSYLELKAAKILKEQRLKELEILSRITFTINCASCKQPNEVTINANDDNYFVCEHCKAKNAAYLTAESALVTTPVNNKL